MSCDSELDQVPFDDLASENAFITAADFENGIRGVYLQSVRGGFYGSSDAGSMLSAPDVLSDNVTLSQNGRFTKRTLHDFSYTPSSAMLTFYRDVYVMVYHANQVLFYAENFEGESKANIVAEAKALRALGHFNLVSIYGKIPTQASDANSSLGIAYVMDADANILPERNTVGDTYAMIVQDLKDASEDINENNSTGRLNKDAVNLLLSRVYLYMGEWQKSINAANAVSANVAPRSSVVGVWEDTNQDGLLFYIPNTTESLGNAIGVAWSQGGVTNLIPEYVTSFDLYNLYADDDIRKEAYIFDAVSDGENVNGIKKLFGRPGGQPGIVDYKIFRSAEASLNRAEAQFNLGNDILARQALDEVRSQRYTNPPSGETGDALRNAIRLERRLEFAFEYQRFFDIKRWAQSVQRANSGDLADGTGTPSDVLTLNSGSNKFQLPFSQSSLDSNSNLQQNPGY